MLHPIKQGVVSSKMEDDGEKTQEHRRELTS